MTGDTTERLLDRFRGAVLQAEPSDRLPKALRMSAEGRLATYYAPFEHVNADARVVLVGITPGISHATVAITELRRQLLAGRSDEEGLRAAKETASFSGSMRRALTDMLNSVGLAQSLAIDDCAAMFGDSRGLVHYTSALRNPVLIDGQNYSGTPGILRTPYLLQMTEFWLGEEAEQLRDALWIPLGREPTAVLGHLVSMGRLNETRVLAGLPHPSGANAERISYFLGRKQRERLSSRTNASALDQARAAIIAKIAVFG